MSSATVLPSTLVKNVGNERMHSQWLQRCDTMIRFQTASVLVEVSALVRTVGNGITHVNAL